MIKKTWRPIIGLEIHVELKTKTKMFCHCPTSHFGKPANTQTCPVCLGLPGALPFANQRAIWWAIKVGLALDCQANETAKFDRKNYFYPDLPKGYQISQYDQPFCQNGRLDSIRIRRVHLEEDTAKMIHQEGQTLVDFNRSGVPLVEIVTEPDLTNSQQAKEFLKHLQLIIRRLGVSDGDLEKGSLRLEVNISLTADGQLPDYKVEIKNLNSFRYVEKAIQFEIDRQSQLLNRGEKPSQETRGWNAKKQQTYSQRSKEEAHDYRYFPEPDLLPVEISPWQIKLIKKQIPELPVNQQLRYRQMGLTELQARIIISNSQKARLFEQTTPLLKNKRQIQTVANLIINQRVNVGQTTPQQLAAKSKRQAPKLMKDEAVLATIVHQVLSANPKAVNDYYQGKKSAVEFLLGQVIGHTRGQAEPNQVRRLISQALVK